MEQIDIFTIETHGSKVMLTHCPTETVGSVTIPDCVTDISISAFRGCTGITSVTIHDGVKSIGESAFNGCTSLEIVSLGNGIKALGTSAFKDCTSLREIVIPDGITNIGGHAFDGCSSLANVQFTENMKVIGHSAFKGCVSLSEVQIPSGIMSIGRYAFHGCTGLRTANIPDGIKTVGGSSFNGCPVLAIESNVFPVIDSVIYTPDMTKAISCTNSEVKNVVIAPSVKDIERGAFRGCVKMESVVIPDGVETIGTSAFQDCKTLKEVVIPESVTKIDDSAFYACISLESVVFPKNLTNVGRWVFDGCLSLKESPIPEPVVMEIIPQDYTPVVSNGTLDIEAIIGTQIPDIAPVYGGVRGRTMSSRHQAYAWPTIAKAGIKTVIELRDGDSSEKLRQLCEQFGMEYFHYPVDNRGGCVESMVELLPRLCEYIDKGNFYIACAMGLHRTDIALCTYWVFYGADRGITPPPIRGYRRDQGHDTNKIMRVLNAIYIRMTEINGAAPMSDEVFRLRKNIINEMSKI